MYWSIQSLKGSENKQEILHYGSIFSAATVYGQRPQLWTMWTPNIVNLVETKTLAA
jgi:hypothetical protein